MYIEKTSMFFDVFTKINLPWNRNDKNFWTSIFDVLIHRNLKHRFILYIDSYSENINVLKNRCTWEKHRCFLMISQKKKLHWKLLFLVFQISKIIFSYLDILNSRNITCLLYHTFKYNLYVCPHFAVLLWLYCYLLPIQLFSVL